MSEESKATIWATIKKSVSGALKTRQSGTTLQDLGQTTPDLSSAIEVEEISESTAMTKSQSKSYLSMASIALYHSQNAGNYALSEAFAKGDVINTFPRDPEYEAIIQEAEMAIDQGVLPELIKKGSSGSYFVKNRQNETIGVFKPTDEEPYSELNPKWGKYIQRKVCCCCFGRGCLILNHGYLSEAGASLVDDLFELKVVPKTRVVCLAARSFNYKKSKSKQFKKKTAAILKRPNLGLPHKAGSFQLFVKDYQDSQHWLKKFDKEPLSTQTADQFQKLFERVVALDYIIRNTDRGFSNWLIRYDKAHEDIRVAAIDNGLAFPFKHPDETRAYPFHWATLPLATKPFSASFKNHMIPKLQNQAFIQKVCDGLYGLFRIDKHFSEAR